MAPEVGRVIALDISDSMLAIARQSKLSNVDFRMATGFSLPGIADGSIDLALGYCVFQHLPSHAALKSYLGEMCRITNPERGMIAFTLTPRNWKIWLLPILRAKAYLREHLSSVAQKAFTEKNGWVSDRVLSTCP